MLVFAKSVQLHEEPDVVHGLTFLELIDQANARKEYRPVAVAVLVRKDKRVLLVSSAHNRAAWGLPQGGIEDGESPNMTIMRELPEELPSIMPSFLTVGRSLGWCDLDTEVARKDRRGFTKGKRYFFCEIHYGGPDELTVNAKEVADYAWSNPTEAESLMVSTRPEKTKMTLFVMNLVK